MSHLLTGLPRPVVAVLRSRSAERLQEVAEILVEAGVPAVELTMTTPGALRTMRALRGSLGDRVTLGAGTVRTVEQLEAAVGAGAEFAVSQVIDAAVLAAARAHGVPFVPGALTPNEIVAAWDSGAGMVKVSPVGPAGGPDYVRELVGPLPEIALFPTGGVTVEAAPAYLEAGASVVGISRHLLLDSLDPDGDLIALRERATVLVDAIDRRTSAAGGATS